MEGARPEGFWQETSPNATAALTNVMRLRRTAWFQFINPALYNELVTREFKRPLFLFGGFAILFAAFAALLLYALPGPRRPFDYMVAGTFATALALVLLFVCALRRHP